MKINIKGMNKYKILAALYNNAKVQGLGIFQYRNWNWTEEDARVYTEENYMSPKWEDMYFDYVYGRVMKVSLDGDILDTRLYDRDNGEGWALNAIWDMWLENNNIKVLCNNEDDAILISSTKCNAVRAFKVSAISRISSGCRLNCMIYPFVVDFINECNKEIEK